MFGWLRNLGKNTSHAVVGHVANKCWTGCFTEAVALHGAQHYASDFWEDVISRFCRKWRNIHLNAPSTLETRCEAYRCFMNEVILGRTHNPPFTTTELELIGEFIALAIVRDIQEALIADPERASLVIELLPRDWLDAANVVPERFDAWYSEMTGKQRTFHRSCA